MILPDVNLLVYAYNADAPLHHKASRWWEESVLSGRSVGVAWPVLQSFLRLLSGRAVVTDPYPITELFLICEEWWAHANVTLLAPSRETYRIFRELTQNYSLAGSATSDALIAAFALEHKARLQTNDTDFRRFAELRIDNPLS